MKTGTLSAFQFTTLNGYMEGPQKGDISWHRHGPEENAFAVQSLGSGHTLLFGRLTYEMMASYWPTPAALENDPDVATAINNASKIVFSTTLKKPGWRNEELVKDQAMETVRAMKEAGRQMTILGSGSLVTQFAEARLIDEFTILLDPLALGNGTAIFSGMQGRLDLELLEARPFKSGAILLRYTPRKKSTTAK
jgi:dihydrofolate reductase